MLIDKIHHYTDRCRQASEAKQYTESVRLLDEFKLELRNAPPSASEIVAVLQQVLADPKMSGASFVFVSAWSNVSDEYSDVLCEILTAESCLQWHEQATELLAELSDPKSIPALTKALGYRWDFDEWHSIPRKALNALAVIESSEAIAAVRSASNADEQSIRDEAVELLKRMTT